jgi:GGDEF domain-containing protein/CHASE3 domain sensor protein
MRVKLILLLGILFIAAIGNSLFIFQLEAHEEEKLAWINHTHEVLDEGQLLLGALKDAETGQRGYLLTGIPLYLQPYHTGLFAAKTHFSKLTLLTSDNEDQQARLKLIKVQMNFKFEELVETIEMMQLDGNSLRAIEMVKSSEGKEYMDEFRLILSEFNNAEHLLLERRKGNYKASRARIATLIIVELVFFISMAVFTILFLQKNLFQPLNLLLANTRKSADGKEIEIGDILQKDEMGYLLSSFFEMNKRVLKKTQDLNYKADHDKLTGLKNRSTMFVEIERSIKHSIKFKTKSALLFIDLNDFKLLNDSLGHAAGDQLLIEIATRLNKSVRSDDAVFRIGGDEFVVLIKDTKSIAEIKKVATNIVSAQ